MGIRVPTLLPRHASDLGRTVFKLPGELLLEIFSYFYGHRRYIRDTLRYNYGLPVMPKMRTWHVERLTVIRKLTMTCWALRETLLPVLWMNTEGCVIESPSDGDETRTTYGLYPQCVYLLSNPTVAAYVQ